MKLRTINKLSALQLRYGGKKIVSEDNFIVAESEE